MRTMDEIHPEELSLRKTRFFLAQHCATLIVQVRLWIAVEDRRQFAKLPLALGSGW